jgi:hypothetical protein
MVYGCSSLVRDGRTMQDPDIRRRLLGDIIEAITKALDAAEANGYERGVRDQKSRIEAFLRGEFKSTEAPKEKKSVQLGRTRGGAARAYGNVVGHTQSALRILGERGPVNIRKIANYLLQTHPEAGISLVQVRTAMKQLSNRGLAVRVGYGEYLPPELAESENSEQNPGGDAPGSGDLLESMAAE